MKTSLNLAPILKKFSYGNYVHPARDWFYLLVAMTVLVALSIGWNLWLLKSVEKGGIIGDENAVVESFDEAPIESVRAVFEERRAEQLRYRQEYRFVDPSL
ncbi:MAG: hypothetical protein Q8S35_00915 [bacterium]|nr:hypothetical protein [bacterium]